MKKIKVLIGIALLILVGFMAFGLFTMPKVQKEDSSSFSALRVAKDLKFISQEHHSIEHPIERARVREYLYDRLAEMGGNPQIFEYDSIESRVGGYIDIANVYSCFDPSSGSVPSSYILFVAHLDSRFRQAVLKDTVYSFGAADDGYGLGVTLELVNMALKYRSEWNQGVKVLFTDAEENHLDGMKGAYYKNREIFDNVGLIVNIEARGVKGPALLFETSPGNSKLIDLYKSAKYPYTYSLTTVVYNMMPNFTDFTVVKDSIPGYNFSVLDNLKYYHTDKDNYSNINLRSIQHYGAQLEPIVKEFLTQTQYADSDFFSSDSDEVFFTVPGLRLIHFSKQQNLLYNSLVFALFCIAFAFHVLSGGVRVGKMFKSALFVFLASLGIAALGEGIAYISAMIAGDTFNITHTQYIKYDNVISIASIALMLLGYILFFRRQREKSRFFVKESLLGTMFAMMMLSAVLLFTVGENFFFMLPVALASVALIFYLFVFFNILSLPALLLIALLEISFLYNLLTALTIGSLGVVMFIAFYNGILIVGLFETYLNQKR